MTDNENKQRRMDDRLPDAQIDWSKPGAPAVQAQAATQALPGIDLDLDTLEALARAATPGPWHWVNPETDEPRQVGEWRASLRTVEEFPAKFGPYSLPRFIVQADEIYAENLDANADFIATANPQTVLALIAKARAAQPAPVSPAGQQAPSDSVADLIEGQKSLPPDIAQVLADNMDCLYETDAAPVAGQQAAPVVAPAEAFAWAVLADNGNVIIWSRRRSEVEPVAAKYGKAVVPVIALEVSTLAARSGVADELLTELDWCIKNGATNPGMRTHAALVAARAALATLPAPAQQAGEADSTASASERAQFEAWMKTCPGYPLAGAFANLMWDAWQARATLAPVAAQQAADAPLPNEPKPCRKCDPSVGYVCEEHGDDEADAYNHACELMEQHQRERAARGVEIGTEGSLCDGIAWLYDRLKKLEGE